MAVEIKEQASNKDLEQISLFAEDIKNLSSKKMICDELVLIINQLLKPKFISFVTSEEKSLIPLSQFGERKHISFIQKTFSREMSNEIYKWVTSNKKDTTINISSNEKFLFVPICDSDELRTKTHGMLMIYLSEDVYNRSTLNILSKIVATKLTCLEVDEKNNKYLEIENQISSELKEASSLKESITPRLNGKLNYLVIEDVSSSMNGNLWWVSDLKDGSNLIFMSESKCKGAPSALLNGYLMGILNDLELSDYEVSPEKILKYLNSKLNSVFKNTSIVVNAWCGIYRQNLKELHFSNANYPYPFLIGTEQQVSNVVSKIDGESLGINNNNKYELSRMFIPSESKLVIFTKDLEEYISKVGNNSDPSWLPQILETVGSLSLPEMKNSIENLLSEEKGGTAELPPRLGLLLEFP